jgi:hypothetical protein
MIFAVIAFERIFRCGGGDVQALSEIVVILLP